jgi:hypothetical protein
MKTAVSFFLAALAALADKKELAAGRTSNDNVAIEARAYLDPGEVQSIVGLPLEPGFIVVEVTLTPKNGQQFKVRRDDFVLLSGRDGQKSTPFAPTQIASEGALVISSRQSGGVMTQQRQRPWGGIGGGPIGGMGMPGGQAGSATAQTSEVVATVKEGDDKKPNPLLDKLREKVLAENEISGPASGQLYFLFEGKQKLKDLELFYKAPGGRLSLKFVR